MRGLRTVRPYGLLVLDHDGVGGDHAHSLAGRDQLVARVEAGRISAGSGHWSARGVEAGLDDTVVTGSELELDHVSNRGVELLRAELERPVAVARYRDDVQSLSGGHTRKGQESASREMHLDYV